MEFVRDQLAFNILSGSYTIQGPFEFNLTQGHNKFTFSECISWLNILKGTVLIIGPPITPGLTPAKLAVGENCNSTDYEYIDTSGNIMLEKLNPTLNLVPFFQVIAMAQPDDIWSSHD